MPSIWTLDSTLPSGRKSLKVKCQALPHDGSTVLRGPLQPACLSQTPITGLEVQLNPLDPRVQLDVAGWSENFFLTQGLPTLPWPPTQETSPLKPVPFWVLQEKQLLNNLPKHFFVAGMDKYFTTSFWWSLSVLLPYWEKIYSLNWGHPMWWQAFQPLEPYSFWLLLRNTLQPLQ